MKSFFLVLILLASNLKASTQDESMNLFDSSHQINTPICLKDPSKFEEGLYLHFFESSLLNIVLLPVSPKVMAYNISSGWTSPELHLYLQNPNTEPTLMDCYKDKKIVGKIKINLKRIDSSAKLLGIGFIVASGIFLKKFIYFIPKILEPILKISPSLYSKFVQISFTALIANQAYSTYSEWKDFELTESSKEAAPNLYAAFAKEMIQKADLQIVLIEAEIKNPKLSKEMLIDLNEKKYQWLKVRAFYKNYAS